MNLLFYLGCCSCYSVSNVQVWIRYHCMPIHTWYFCILFEWSIKYASHQHPIYHDDWNIIIQLYFICYYLIFTWNEYFIHVLFCMSVPAHKISKALWWSIYWSTINTWCKEIYIKDNMLQGWNQWKPSNTRTQFSFQDSLKQIETNIGLFYFVFKVITMNFRRQFHYFTINMGR